MLVDGMNGRSGAKREKREETMSKHQIQPGVGNERVDAGGEDRISLAKPNSQAGTNPFLANHEQDRQRYRFMPNVLDT